MSDQWNGAERAKVNAAYVKMTPGPWRYYKTDNIIVDPGNLRTIFSFQPRGPDRDVHGDGIVEVVNAYPHIEAALTEVEQALRDVQKVAKHDGNCFDQRVGRPRCICGLAKASNNADAVLAKYALPAESAR